MIEDLKNNVINHIKGTSPLRSTELKIATEEVFSHLDQGTLRVVEKNENGHWIVNEWIKEAILIYFKTSNLQKIENGFDKIPLKTSTWTEENYIKAAFRLVPGSIVRHGCYIAENVIIMPSFINVGAYIDSKTMVDSGVTVGSCSYIGKGVHLSSNVVIGGVLEPVQAMPVIVEDNCFIGAGSNILEGMIIEEGAVISAGVTLTASTKILERETGTISYGKIPAYSVVVSGMYPSSNGTFLSCAVIVKKVDAKTRNKTKINDLLRDI